MSKETKGWNYREKKSWKEKERKKEKALLVGAALPIEVSKETQTLNGLLGPIKVLIMHIKVSYKHIKIKKKWGGATHTHSKKKKWPL